MRESKRSGRFAPLAGAFIGTFAGAVLLTTHASQASVVIDGTLDAGYGGPLSTQTIGTQFGDNGASDGTSSGGSELDAAYGVVEGTNLNLFLSGNFQNNGNHLNIFFSDGRSGQSVLSAGGTLSGANGLTFPTGFSATYAIDANDFSNTVYFDTYDLVGNTNTFAGGISLTGGVGTGSLTGGLMAGINNTNTAGVGGGSGAASAAAANAVSTGIELSIPLSALGNPSFGSPIQVIAAINGGGDNFLSNQFLGGLPVGYGNLGNPSGVNLNGASTPFVVSVPEPTGAALFGFAGGAFVLLSKRSRRPATVSI